MQNLDLTKKKNQFALPYPPLKPRDKELEAKLAYLCSLTLLQNHGDQNNVAEVACSMFLVQNSPEILTDNCESSPSKVTHDASFAEGPRALVTYSEPSSLSTPTALLVHAIFVLGNLTTSQEIVAFLNRTNAQRISHGPQFIQMTISYTVKPSGLHTSSTDPFKKNLKV